MRELLDVLQREFVYVNYYFMVQLRQIAGYWVLGMVVGSLVSVFAQDAIHGAFAGLKDKRLGVWGVVPASLLGVASPLCMYGTIPIAAAFARGGMRQDWLAAFMMSSVLLNPQLILYSTALGPTALAIRVLSCTVCGIAAGLLLHVFYKDKPFFDFTGFAPRASHDTHPNLFLRFVFNLGRNIRATLFGKANEGFGVLMAATIGVPLYACGGGTIPLIREWLAMGMSMGSAAAFMLTGPATKITNLGALKIVLGAKRFALYLAFVMAFALGTGLLVNILV